MMQRQGQSGASAVEFALVLPLLIVLVIGIIEFSLAWNRSQAMHAAAREAARVAAIGRPYDVVASAVGQALTGIPIDSGDVAICVDDNSGSCDVNGSLGYCDNIGDEVRVRVWIADPDAQEVYAPRIPFVTLGDRLDLASQAVFRCEQRPS